MPRKIKRTFRHKLRQKGKGFFTKKSLEDNRRNCIGYWNQFKSEESEKERDRLCYNDVHLNERPYPGKLNRFFGKDLGSKIGTTYLK